MFTLTSVPDLYAILSSDKNSSNMLTASSRLLGAVFKVVKNIRCLCWLKEQQTKNSYFWKLFLSDNGFPPAGSRIWLGAPCCCCHILHWKVDGKLQNCYPPFVFRQKTIRDKLNFRQSKLEGRGRLLACPTQRCTARSSPCSTATRERIRFCICEEDTNLMNDQIIYIKKEI